MARSRKAEITAEQLATLAERFSTESESEDDVVRLGWVRAAQRGNKSAIGVCAEMYRRMMAPPRPPTGPAVRAAMAAEAKLASIARTRRPTDAETAEAHAAYAAAAAEQAAS